MLEGMLNQTTAKGGRKSLVIAEKFLCHCVRRLKTKPSNLSVHKAIAFKNHLYVEYVKLFEVFFQSLKSYITKDKH